MLHVDTIINMKSPHSTKRYKIMSSVKGSSVLSTEDLWFTEFNFDQGNTAVAKILWAQYVVAKLHPKYSALKLKNRHRFFWYMTCISMSSLFLLLSVKFWGIIGKVSIYTSTVHVNRKIEAMSISTHLGWQNSSLHFMPGNLLCC